MYICIKKKGEHYKKTKKKHKKLYGKNKKEKRSSNKTNDERTFYNKIHNMLYKRVKKNIFFKHLFHSGNIFLTPELVNSVPPTLRSNVSTFFIEFLSQQIHIKFSNTRDNVHILSSEELALVVNLVRNIEN